MNHNDSDPIPTVSIVMNCYNCSRYLKEAIDSVYSQTFDDWEIIFWDNLSTDSSSEIAKSYNQKLRYFCGKKNVPLGHARNYAIEHARGEYVAFLDCDDTWLPTKLEKQLRVFENDQNVKLVFSDCNIVNKQHNIINTSFSIQTPYRGHIFNELLSHYSFIPLVTVLVSRSIFEEVGTFDNDYEIAEEYELFLRIAQKHPFDFIDEPLANYRVHDSNWSHKQDVGINEELKIMNHWLTEIPDLDKNVRKNAKKKILRRKLALYNYYIVSKLKLPKILSKFY